MEKLPISLVTIVRNANGRLKKLIEAHRDIVSEVIVVDQGSTDGTYEEAVELADKVFSRKCKGTSDPDRNWAFALAENPFVLYLDDDEVLTDSAKEVITDLVKGDGDIFWFKRLNLMDGVDIYPILGDDYQCRLFRKGSVRFHSEIHHFPECASNTKIFYLNAQIKHERTLEQAIKAHKNREPRADKKIIDMQNKFLADVKALVEENKGFTENWYSNDQLESLKQACEKAKDLTGQVIEIGCWEGKSTCTIANCFPDDEIVAVDTWKGNLSEGESHPSVVAAKDRDVYSTFLANVKRLTKGNVKPFVSDCFDFLAGPQAPVKFVHIDAGHDYGSVKKTIETLKPFLVKGAVLCGDDFASANKNRKDLDGGVERAVVEMCPGFVSKDNFWAWINK